MQEKRFGLWKCYSCKSLIPDSIVQTHTVPFRILESQDDNWKHIWKTWQALILSFKWWPSGTSRKLQLFHNISCSCCRKFRPTFALSWVMCVLNKACPGHWNFSPFHQLIKWQGNRTLTIRRCYCKPTRFVPEQQTRATAGYRLKPAFTGY